MTQQHNAHMIALYYHRIALAAARQREERAIRPMRWWEFALAILVLLPWTLLTGSAAIKPWSR